MEAVYQGTALRSGRAAGTGAVKVNDIVPPTLKRRVSAASIFKQHPRTVKKSGDTPVFHVSTMKKPARAKPRSSSSPGKVTRNSWSKRVELHPLAASFEETSRVYRHTLLKNNTKKLDDTLSHLLNQLHHLNLTTLSSPSRASDPDGSPQKLTIADKADRTARKLFMPIGSYEVTVARNGLDGKEYHTNQTLEDGLMGFRARHRARLDEIHTLEKTWETVVGEIWKVGVTCLGEDAMSALLLTHPTPPPLPPVNAGRHNLMLPDLDPKPARKKVKFEEPVPKLPKFLSAASVYPDSSIPEQLSKEDVKKLKDMVNDFGTTHIEALARVKKDGDVWWEKKQEQMVRALKED